MLNLLNQLPHRLRKKPVMGKVHRPIGSRKFPIPIRQKREDRLIAMRLSGSLQYIEEHLIHPVQIAGKVVKTQFRAPPVRMLCIKCMHFPPNAHMRLQHRLQGTKGRRPPHTPSRWKRSHIVSASRQHIRLIHRDKPCGWGNSPLGQLSIQQKPQLFLECGQEMWGPLIQPRIRS